MTKKDVVGEIPADIAAMDEEQLKNLEDYRLSAFGRSEFEQLVAARDEAQTRVDAWTKIGYFISQRRVQILAGKLQVKP